MYIVGIPKELKQNEQRVSLIPEDVAKLTANGIEVYIQKDAGNLANNYNEEYMNVGAKICNTIEDIYKNCNFIIKVKEPQEYEYKLINSSHTIFAFFHFASNNKLQNAMINSGSTCYTYETIKVDGFYPILSLMSKIAGEQSMMDALKFKFKDTIYNYNINISIFGAGNAGLAAMNIALNSGFTNINLLDINYEKLTTIKNNHNANIYEMNDENLRKLVNESDIIIGSIYNTGEKAAKLITNELLDTMKPNSIIMDIAIDQGGITEQSKPTSIANPIIKYKNANISCIPNIPSCLPEQASKLLSNSIIKYVIAICNNSEIYPELEFGKGLSIKNYNNYN